MDENLQQEKKQRISNTNAALMVATALILDLISIIPAVGQAIADVGSFVIFLIWFLILGLPLVTPKKLLTVTLAYVVEVIPAISALPAITAGVILMIVFSRAEDKTGLQLIGAKGMPNAGNIAKAGSTLKEVGTNVIPKATPRMNDMLSSSA